MNTINTYFPCYVLRDAMQVAAMFAADDNEGSRMTFDADGMHIRSRNDADSVMAWVDIPLKSPSGSLHFEDGDIGINPDKLYRMLSAYESDDMINFLIDPHPVYDTHIVTLRGDLGMLGCTQSPIIDTPLIPVFDYVRRCRPPVVQGDVGGDMSVRMDHFRGWFKRIEADDETVVSFHYKQPHSRFPIMMISEHTSLEPQIFVLSHPSFPEGIGDLSTDISLELLHTALAPSCITGAIMFSFGNDTPLYLKTQVNDCIIRVAIAPRIEA